MDKLYELLSDIEILFGENSKEYDDAFSDFNDIYESIKDLEQNITNMIDGA